MCNALVYTRGGSVTRNSDSSSAFSKSLRNRLSARFQSNIVIDIRTYNNIAILQTLFFVVCINCIMNILDFNITDLGNSTSVFYIPVKAHFRACYKCACYIIYIHSYCILIKH